MLKRHHTLLLGIAALVGLVILTHSERESANTRAPRNGLSALQEAGELVVLTRNAPTIYYQGREGLAGPEYDMMRDFAESLGVKLRVVVNDNIEDIFVGLGARVGHIAAAGLTRTKSRIKKYLAGPVYEQVTQQVVCRRGGARPRDIDDLVGLNIAVAAGSSYSELMAQHKGEQPQLKWDILWDTDTEELLERVWLKKLDCTVADSNIVAVNRRYHPELSVAFDLNRGEQLVWYLSPDASALHDALRDWFRQYRRSGRLQEMRERYYGFIDNYDFVDTRVFVKRIYKRLPKYRELFEQAALDNDINWSLLAAQAYQESHWNPRARSPTGVRGIMMLTLNTASELGIKNRLDPRKSIEGGAEYLAGLRKRLPESIEEPDRTWIALAAYNIGMGHIYDARRLARSMDKNPDIWAELKDVLPLLAQKKYYKKLKYGYARGAEPVLYVSRIRNFEDILLRHVKVASR